MELIAHRGLWKSVLDQNSLAALARAFQNGMGVETDVRHFRGELFLSHDPIEKQNGLVKFGDLVELGMRYPKQLIFLNIKEDGLQPFFDPYSSLLSKCSIVFFDMSVPELVRYSKLFPPENLCTRFSDAEPVPSAVERCDWLWVDGFERDVDLQNLTSNEALSTRNLAFVSPQIHGRNASHFLKSIQDNFGDCRQKIALCADFPENKND